MNKIIKEITLHLILITFLISCRSDKVTVNVIHSTNNYPIVIRLSTKYKKIFRIKIPVILELKNNSILNKNFISINYDYGSIKNKGVIEFIFKEINNELVEVGNNKKKSINLFNSKKYIVYSSHKLDSTKLAQQQLQPYIEKILRLNQDTLHIGTVSKFKQNHKELFNKLTKNDSISIRFLDKSKKSGLGKKITVAVAW